MNSLLIDRENRQKLQITHDHSELKRKAAPTHTSRASSSGGILLENGVRLLIHAQRPIVLDPRLTVVGLARARVHRRLHSARRRRSCRRRRSSRRRLPVRRILLVVGGPRRRHARVLLACALALAVAHVLLLLLGGVGGGGRAAVARSVAAVHWRALM